MRSAGRGKLLICDFLFITRRGHTLVSLSAHVHNNTHLSYITASWGGCSKLCLFTDKIKFYPVYERRQYS